MGVLVDADFVELLEEWAGLMDDAGIAFRFTSGFRSAPQQRAAFKRHGARGLAAQPGRSFHEVGLAVDFIADPRSHQRDAGALAESIGLRWGGRFRIPDPVHLDAGHFIRQQDAVREGYPIELVEVG